MKRPVVWYAAALACGIFVYLNFSVPLLILMSAMWLYTVFAYKRLVYLTLTAVMLFGVASGFVYQARVLSPVEYYDGRCETFTGEIKSREMGSRGRYLYEVENVRLGNLPAVSARVYAYQKAEAGDIAEFCGDISVTSCMPSNHSFNYKAYLINRGFLFTAYAKITRVTGKSSGFINNFRDFITGRIRKFASASNRGFLTAALMGSKDGLDKYINEIFKKTGLTHLLVVSGMHVSAMLGFLYVVLRKAPGIITALTGTAFLVFMVLLLGTDASIMRAVIMGLMLLWSGVLYGDSDTLSNLCTSAIAILLVRPYSLLDGGFILSYTATGGIILLSPVIESFFVKTLKAPCKLLSVTVAVFIFLIPANIYYNGEFSLLSLITNIIFTPVFPAIMVLLLVTAVFGDILPFLPHVLNRITDAYIQAIEASAEISRLTFRVSEPSVYFALLVLSAVLFFLFKNKRMRYMLFASAVCLCILSGMDIYNSMHSGKICFADAGSISNVIISTPDKSFIAIDSTKSYITGYDGDNLIAFVEKSGIKGIDILHTINYNKNTEYVSGKLERKYGAERVSTGEFCLWDGVNIEIKEGCAHLKGDVPIMCISFGDEKCLCESGIKYSVKPQKLHFSADGDEINAENIEISFDRQGVRRPSK